MPTKNLSMYCAHWILFYKKYLTSKIKSVISQAILFSFNKFHKLTVYRIEIAK